FQGIRIPHKLNLPDFTQKESLPPTFINEDLYQKSLINNNENYFFSFIEQALNKEALEAVKNKYKIGTSRKWKGATVFWQIDENLKVRTGKLMLYNKTTGKKSKVNWVHSILKIKDFNLKQCLFGLHLMNSD